jgi:rhamnose utilization protein RhaD (predicted bifunctional aldolase and dehydrogenase)
MKELLELAAVSAVIGSNFELIQGQGGNTSYKKGKSMWVKASGKRLADALEEEIFVHVDMGICQQALFHEDDTIIQSAPSVTRLSTMRPSIETSLHAVFESDFVLHTHAVNTIAVSVLRNADEVLGEKLRGLSWGFVPYYKPGMALAKAIDRLGCPSVVVLGNHGLVTSSNSLEDARSLTDEVENRLRPVTDITDSTLSASPSRIEGYVSLSSKLVQKLVNDQVLLDLVCKAPLYPDHVVFLGAEIKVYEKDYLPTELPSWFIIRGDSIYVEETRKSAVDIMIDAFVKIVSRIDSDSSLQYLSDSECLELMTWDMEKHRKNNS